MEIGGEGGNDRSYFILQISFPRSFKVTKVRKNRRMAIKNITLLIDYHLI